VRPVRLSFRRHFYGRILGRGEPAQVAVVDPLRVREQQAVPEGGEALDGRVELVVEPAERALEQQPLRVPGALGDQLQLTVVQRERVLVGELAARVQCDLQALGADGLLELLPAAVELEDVDFREVRALDVRRGRDIEHVLAVEQAGEMDGVSESAGAVVEARQDVAMKVDVRHAL